MPDFKKEYDTFVTNLKAVLNTKRAAYEELGQKMKVFSKSLSDLLNCLDTKIPMTRKVKCKTKTQWHKELSDVLEEGINKYDGSAPVKAFLNEMGKAANSLKNDCPGEMRDLKNSLKTMAKIG